MKTNSALISVILPTYNSKKFIKYSVNSVLKQSYSNFELIIVDDCSTDESYELIQNLKKKDKRIKYIRTKKNSKTVGHPRNIGVKHSKGKFIAFIDADDYWYPDKLKLQMQNIRDKDMLSCTASNYIKEGGKKKSNFIINYLRIIIQTFIFNKLKKGRYHWLYIYNPVIISSVLINKKVFNRIQFNENENIREDLFFWFNLFPYIKNNFIYLNMIYCTITRAKNSMSSEFKKEFNKIINSISKNFSEKNDFSKFHFLLIGIFLRILKIITSIIYKKIRKTLIRTIIILIALYFTVFYSPFFWHLGNKLVSVDRFKKTESIVLLSGHDEVNYFNNSYQKRYNDIIELLEEHKFYPKIFLIGRNQIIPEQKILKSLLLEYGIEDKFIVELTDTKKDTKENLRYINETLEKNNVESTTLISAPYHTLRIRLLLKKLDTKVEYSIYQKIPKKNNFFERSLNKKIILYEYLSILYNKLNGKL
jgi:teichuronic acid biosynthesis glycosyltransferase TuaG